MDLSHLPTWQPLAKKKKKINFFWIDIHIYLYIFAQLMYS